MNDDRERLEHYLHWRDRTHGRRRRWLRGVALMLAPLIVVFGLLAWLAQSREPTRPGPATPVTKRADIGRESREPASAPSEAASVTLDLAKRADSSPPNDSARAVERSRAPHRPAAPAHRTTGAPARSSRERAAAGQSPTESNFVAPAPDRQTQSMGPVTPPISATRPDVSDAPGDIAPTPLLSERADTRHPAPRALATSDATASGDTPAAGVPPSRSGEAVQSVEPTVAAPSTFPEHRSQEAAIARPRCADVAAASVDGRSRKQRIVDCIGGWLEGESQEFRAGLTREIEEFRSGIDKVGLGLQWLGGKLRR